MNVLAPVYATRDQLYHCELCGEREDRRAVEEEELKGRIAGLGVALTLNLDGLWIEWFDLILLEEEKERERMGAAPVCWDLRPGDVTSICGWRTRQRPLMKHCMGMRKRCATFWPTKSEHWPKRASIAAKDAQHIGCNRNGRWTAFARRCSDPSGGGGI